jgi:two-component system, OmpR family, response regulator
MGIRDSATILIVDDEEAVRAVLKECLAAEGFTVLEASNGVEMARLVTSSAVDLITLDLNLAGEDGLKLARDIRSKNNVPIVMITAKSDTIDRVVGLELGADDYIPKPFHPREVLARIRSVLRRYQLVEPIGTGVSEGNASPRYRFDERILDVARRTLANSAGHPIDLTTTEFDLLLVFLHAPGRVLSRDQIMDQLKGRDWSPLDRSIDSMVARLRRKIEPENETPKLIKTVRGVGYVFAGSVKRDTEL